MAKAQGIKRVLWSLDAFENPDDTRVHVANVVRTLQKYPGVRVEPVYVLSPDQLDVSFEFSPPWLKKYRPAAEKSLGQLLKDANVPGLMKPHVIVHNRPSLSGAVRALSAYAKNVNADLIVVGTHARKGLSRLFLGSFAETLLQHSKIPVIVVGVEAAPVESFESILFATDFGKQSEVAFNQVLGVAKAMGSSLTIFHAIPNPIEPVFQSGVYLLGGGWVPVTQYLKSEEEERRKLGQAWVKKAEKAGVKAHFVLDRKGHGIVESVVEAADSGKVGLIAMAAQSGRLATALVGSVTRTVVRNAHRPVWVLRT